MVLIGLDGATFHVLDPLMKDGVMPFLRDFVKSGVRAELNSVIPPITPPAWTSLVTGRNPGAHGVFDFFQKEAGSAHIRFTTSQDVRCETLWSMASRHGARVTTLNFPLMMPPPAINGNVISGGWITWRQLRLGCHPEGLYDKIKALPGFNPKNLALDMSHEAKALEGCREEDYEPWVRLHIQREQLWGGILEFLMEEDPSDLTALLFDGVDKIQHLCWRFISPDSENLPLSSWEGRIRELCLEYFSKLDGLLRRIVELAGADATVLMASDHGFGAQRETFFVNAWLEKNGYLKWAGQKEGGGYDASGILGMSQLAKHVYMIDWNETCAYASTPSSNGIHIVRAAESGQKGVKDSEYESFREALKEKLYTIAGPGGGAPVVKHVFTREEAFQGPTMNDAPDLTLVLRDGGLVSILPSHEVVKVREKPSGTHRREGVFMAKGPGISEGLTSAPLSILDVMPVALYSLGIPIPEEIEGRFPQEIFDPKVLKQRPPVIAGHALSTLSAETEEEQVFFDAESEAKMADLLKSLGYME
jgi:predicted AlkP superfamily phosphohydrolase/phosphomutase